MRTFKRGGKRERKENTERLKETRGGIVVQCEGSQSFSVLGLGIENFFRLTSRSMRKYHMYSLVSVSLVLTRRKDPSGSLRQSVILT